jgi:hypothetical protein
MRCVAGRGSVGRQVLSSTPPRSTSKHPTRKLVLLAAPALLALGLALPASASAATSATCTKSDNGASCGPYTDHSVTFNNGFNTYVVDDCWAEPQCTYTINSRNPGDWSVTDPGDEPAGSTSVATYPDVQQLTNDFDSATHTWGTGSDNTPLSGVKTIHSSFKESMPDNSRTIAEFGYDIWTNYPSDVMVWTDNVNRGTGGATKIGAMTYAGQHYTVYVNGTVAAGGEIIFSLDGDNGKHTSGFAHETSGTVHILAVLGWLQRYMTAHGYSTYASELGQVGQIDAGWEICSSGGTSETFSMSSFTLRATARS